MKALSKSDKLKSFIAPKMTDIITFLDNHGNSAIYTGVSIHGLYCYIEIIGSPSTLTTSSQSAHHFDPSYFINIDTQTLQPVIVDLHIHQEINCELLFVNDME